MLMASASIQTLRTDAEASVLGEGALIGRGGEGVLQTVTVDGDLEWFVHAADRLPGRPSHGRGGDRGEAAELSAAVSGEDMEREQELGSHLSLVSMVPVTVPPTGESHCPSAMKM